MTDPGRTEALLRIALRAARVGLWDWDIAANKVVFSPEWKRLLGYEEAEISDDLSEWEDRVHPDDLPRLRQLRTECLEQRGPDFRAEYRMRHKDGTWHWILAQADLQRDTQGRPSHLIGNHIDITERKRSEASLARANRALRMLSESIQVLIRAEDESTLLRELCRIATEIGGYRMAWVGFVEGAEATRLRPVAHAGLDEGYFATTGFSLGHGRDEREPAAKAIATGKPCIVRDIPSDSAFAAHREAALQHGYRSAIALPLLDGGRVFGVFKIYASESDAFDPGDVTILTELAGDVAHGVSALRTRTERDRATEALRVSNRQLEAAQRLAHIGHWEQDLERNAVTWSDETYRILGRLPRQPLASTLSEEQQWQLVHQDDRARVAQAIQDAIAGGTPQDLEYRVVRPDGTVVFLHGLLEVEKDAGGRPQRILGVMQDITGGKQVEASLRDTELRLSALMEGFPDLVSRFDTEGRFIYISPSSRRTMGAMSETVLGRTPLEVGVSSDPDGDVALQESLARVVATGRSERLEAGLKTLAGPRQYEVRHIPEKDERGSVIGVLGIASDMTERKVAERQLYLLNRALDNIRDGIFLIEGESGRFVYANRCGAESLQRSREELTGGMGVADIDPDFSPVTWENFWAELRRQGHVTLETAYRAPDGRSLQLEVSASLVEFEGKRHNLAIVRDISDRKASEQAQRESETTYRSLVSAMAEGVVFQAADGTITAVNPAAERILCLSGTDMRGRTSESPQWGAIHEDGSPFPGEEHPAMVTVRTGEPQVNVVMGVRNPDGDRTWISINSQPLVRSGETRPYAVVTTFHDITEWRRAAAAVAAREREYRTLAENTPDFLVRWDRDLRRVFVNPAFAQAMGSSPDRVIGTAFGTQYPAETVAVLQESLARLGERLRKVFESGEATEEEVNWFTVEGPRVFLLRLVPERSPDGSIPTVLGLGRDITALKETERQLRTLTEHSPDIILRFDCEGRYLYANGALEQLTGVPAEEHIGQRLGEVTGTGPHGGAPEVYRRLRDRIAGVCSSGTAFESEVRLPLRDSDHVFNVRLIPEKNGEGDVASVLAVARDITEGVRAEEALRASEQRFRQVTENIDEVFWLTDAAKTEMIYLSPAYERVFGRSRDPVYADAQAWLDAIHPEDRQRVTDALPTQALGTYDLEYRVVQPAGSVRWIHERAFPIRDVMGEVYRIAGVAEDVTVRRQLEDQLRQAQKMDAVGQLAGGIAHDFNNILAVIQMQSTLLLEDTGGNPETREGVREILAATERASNLTRQLLTFSRRQVSQPVDLDISDTIDNVVKMLRRLLGEHIVLETRFAPSHPLIHADPGMMEQVLMNLAINARDAMPEGGRLSVILERVAVDELRAALHPGAAAGPHVCLTVSDTGCGIPAESLPRIFEPFYTTKEVGRGTGLGLATVFGIVQQHHGWIEVESVVGRGTTFRVLLPALSASAVTSRTRAAPAAVRGGSETILLVEDEPSVRSVTRAVLERYGYRVLEAESPSKAMDLWARHAGEVDLLVTDLIMPGGTSGRQLAEGLVQTKPGLKVIYISGYSPDVVNRLLRLDPRHTLLQKPYEVTELAVNVRRTLDERPA